jgi:hypothetical protein
MMKKREREREREKHFMFFIVIFATNKPFLVLLPSISNIKKVLKTCSYQTRKQLFNNSTFDKSSQAKSLNSKALLSTSIPNRLITSRALVGAVPSYGVRGPFSAGSMFYGALRQNS